MSADDKNLIGYSIGFAMQWPDGSIWVRTYGGGPGGTLWDGGRTVKRHDPDYPFWHWMARSEDRFDHDDLPKLEAEFESALAADPALSLQESLLETPGRFVLMPPDYKIDTWKSLAELSGVDWGPPFDGMRVRTWERHEWRRQQIVDLTNEGLIRLLDLGRARDAKFLVPVALARLQKDAKPAERTDQVKLLCAVLRQDDFPWRAHPESVQTARELKDRTLHHIMETMEPNELPPVEREIQRSSACFEAALTAA